MKNLLYYIVLTLFNNPVTKNILYWDTIGNRWILDEQAFNDFTDNAKKLPGNPSVIEVIRMLSNKQDVIPVKAINSGVMLYLQWSGGTYEVKSK